MDPILDSKITAYLDSHREDMIADLRRLVAIGSAKSEALPGAPFGQGTRDCLLEALALCEGAGLSTRNVDGYCGYGQWGEGEEHVASLSHLDTVPIGDGWTHGPLAGEVADGFMYGRGTSDDKGGAIASLYAVKALMAAGFTPRMPIRLIFGCDEECGMSDMPYYLAHEKAPRYAFSPDAGFPLYYAEKGRLEGHAACALSGKTNLLSLKSGSAANVVPADAVAVLTDMALSDLPDAPYISFAEDGGKVAVRADGIACHGGAPQGGRNAACLLMNYLADALPEGDAAKAPLARFKAMIGMCLDGAQLGIDCTDEVSGGLTMNIGIAEGSPESLSFVFDIRHPVTLDESATAAKLVDLFAENGWTLPMPHVSKPLYVPLDSPLVTTLMEVYRDITGDMTPPATMGGGTYARTLPCAVSYGHGFRGDNSRGHTYDENINLAHLAEAARIYAHALARLSCL